MGHRGQPLSSWPGTLGMSLGQGTGWAPQRYPCLGGQTKGPSEDRREGRWYSLLPQAEPHANLCYLSGAAAQEGGAWQPGLYLLKPIIINSQGPAGSGRHGASFLGSGPGKVRHLQRRWAAPPTSLGPQASLTPTMMFPCPLSSLAGISHRTCPAGSQH
jgi:hypothetical protein